LSILPILALSGMREALADSPAPRVAVSPLIGGQAVRGPAASLMGLAGRQASALGVADLYAGVIDGIVIDCADVDEKEAIEALGIRVLVTETLMRTTQDKERLASEVLAFARTLR
jgi:LPPG:FO 2-phospho-L-lactate transferase